MINRAAPTRRDFLASTSLAAIAFGSAGCTRTDPATRRVPTAAARKPNLLLIWTDQQRYDTLAAYGNRFIQVPTLNRLASQSVVFERHYVTQAICTPSRATVMTGLYPHQHRCISNNTPLSRQCRTLPELLGDADYRTGYFGKWHLGDEVFAQRGFEEWGAIEDEYGGAVLGRARPRRTYDRLIAEWLAGGRRLPVQPHRSLVCGSAITCRAKPPPPPGAFIGPPVWYDHPLCRATCGVACFQGFLMSDPFLNAKIDALHPTFMQQKLQAMAPMPVGVVFLPWPGMTEEEARQHFRTMKQLGFTCLKQTMPTPEWPTERTLLLALEEGIMPFWYAEAGYESITPELLRKLGLPETMSLDEAIEHPAMWEHQKEVFRRRILRGKDPLVKHAGGGEDEKKKDITWVPGVVGDIKGHELHPEALPAFVEWLKRQYTTVENLKEAWNFRHVGIGGKHMNWQSWDDVLPALQEGLGGREYRHLRDLLRFRADTFTRQYIGQRVAQQQQLDRDEPLRAGGEMGLFLSFASRGTDMEQIALEMAEGGSFYPSIHMAWHFEEVDFEIARPMYMQASIAHDWAKGIWSATWESTGGPQYFSGGKAPFVPEARDKQPGFTTDERTMEHLMLSWLAGGFKGFGLWCWNARTAGWEAGEYALLDRNRNVTPRAIRAGEIGRAARRHRRELWAAHKEPIVGVLQDWENEAFWACMAVTGRDFYKQVPVRARVGVSRALINANVPWEYVTARNLAQGLGPRYKCIYVPAFISLSSELQASLLAYVRQGGRLVLDMPGAYYDEFGRVFNTDKGSVFEQTFGVVLREFTFGAQINVPHSIEKVPADGFTASLAPTTARVVAKYDQHNRPAITENKVGSGTAVLLAAQASLNCFKPGNKAMEDLIVRHTLADYRTPYACEGALVYRLAAPAADHYFLINDGPERGVTLNTKNYQYKKVSDAISGEPLPMSMPIRLPAWGGRWLRFEK